MLGCFLLLSVLFINSQEVEAAEANLAWGSTGQAVMEVQQALNQKGFWCGEADGIFGPNTYNAVLRFQRAANLSADGIVGPQTKQALGLTAGQNVNSNSTVSRSGSTVARGRTVYVVATGYCSCNKCNYPYGGKPSYLGHPLRKGIVAVDPKVIPMGSKLYIEGYGEGIASDQGNAIKGNRIDLCFNSHQEALNWGIRTVKVTIY